MKTLTASAMAAMLLASLAGAQTPAAKKLDLNFPNLAAKAKEKSEVDLGGAALEQAKAATSELSGLSGVVVRHYEFGEAGAYSNSELDPLRKQVAADPAWSRILSVKEKNEDTQIFVMVPGAGQAGGFLVISAEAKEVNVVQILGSVELAQLKEIVNSSVKYDLKAAANAK